MKERIKDTLVEKMIEIHGEKADGWWYHPDTLNEVAEAVMEVLNDE